MKKTGMACLIGVVGFLMIGPLLSARHRPEPDYLTFSFFITPLHVGYKHRLIDNIYAVGNMDYLRVESDLQFQLGAIYMIPRKIWFFRIYGGGGFQFSRDQRYQYPYLTIGSNFWLLFWDINHPLQKGAEPDYRFGFCFKF